MPKTTTETELVEIGAVKNRVPVYGLKLRGDAA